MKLESIQQKLQESGKNFSWKGRLLLHLIFIYFGIRYLFNKEYGNILTYFNLGVHELGHFVFEFVNLGTAGGTLLQIIAPTVYFFGFHEAKDYYSAFIVTGVWLSTGLYHAAWYIGTADGMDDARMMISADGSRFLLHDWVVMLQNHGLQQYALVFSKMVYVVAFILLWGFILAGGYIIYQMYLGSGKSGLTRAEWELSRFLKRSSRNVTSKK